MVDTEGDTEADTTVVGYVLILSDGDGDDALDVSRLKSSAVMMFPS